MFLLFERITVSEHPKFDSDSSGSTFQTSTSTNSPNEELRLHEVEVMLSLWA